MSVIGISLGTTNSCVAVSRNGEVKIVQNDRGNTQTPSYVSFSHRSILVGEAAEDEFVQNPANTIYEMKRLIGKNYDDPCVQEDLKRWGFKVINEDNKPKVQVAYGATFYPQEISAMILKELKRTAEDFLKEDVTDAVITVPAYFNDSQRRATIDAGRIAGMNACLLTEPTAAATAYGLARKETKERNILIFHLGGETLDVTVLSVKDGVIYVKATGDAHIGGEDFTKRMVQYFVEMFNRAHKVDISENKRAMNRLGIHCEAAKRRLCVSTRAGIQVDALHHGIDFKTTISQAMFEHMNFDFFVKMLEPVEKTLRKANMNKEKIDEVILTGGSTRIPRIRQMLENVFDSERLRSTISPEEVVAYGAAVYAARRNEQKVFEVLNITPHTSSTPATSYKRQIYPHRERPARVLILCNFEHQLIGYKEDVRKLEVMWKDFGCVVETKKDLTASGMKLAIKEFAYEKLTGNEYYAALFVLSHGGGDDQILGADQQFLSVKEILKHFNNENMRLQHMPKMLFFQICRGALMDPGVINIQTASAAFVISEIQKMPTVTDTLVFFPAQKGDAAFVEVTGSWFIQSIVNIFQKYADTEHVADMLTMVSDEVAQKTAAHVADKTIDGRKSMSLFESTFRKKLYIRHNTH